MSIAREKAEIRHSTESRKQRAECRLDLLLHFEGRFEQILMDGARISDRDRDCRGARKRDCFLDRRL